jgi:Cof subfamily protein (haloacid dehalogenase superfamily)
MIKVIASDMDGTLLNSRHEISKENLEAIKKAQDKGVHFVIVTGREFNSVNSYIKELNLDCECILMNGAEYRDKNGKVIENISMDKKQVREILGIMDKEKLAVEIFTSDGVFVTNRDNHQESIFERFKMFSPHMTDDEIKEFIENRAEIMNVNHIDNIDDFLNSDIDILKIITFNKDTEFIASVKEKLKKIDNLAVASTFSNDIELNNIRAQKGIILSEVIEKMGIRVESLAIINSLRNGQIVFK